MILSEAPIKKPIIKESIVDGKVWMQWFTSLADAIKGEWTEGSKVIIVNSPAPTPISNYFSVQGRQVFCRIKWNATTLGGTLELFSKFEDGILNLYDGTTLLQGVKVVDNIVTLPSLSTSGETILTGTLVLKRS